MTRDSRTTDGPALVLGGTGKVGRRVAERLNALGRPVRIGSRSGRPPFDWEDRSTWRPALEGTSSAYVTYYPDLAVPGAAAAVGEFAEAALDTGTRRLVLLSGRGEEGAQNAERVLQDSDAELTIVRSALFSQNFSESFFVEPLLAGEVAFPADRVREPFVDAGDIADVVAAALTEDGHVGQVYEVTGPRLLTFAQAVDEIARATGREVAYVPMSMEEWAVEMAAAGVPEEVVALLTSVFAEVLDGRNAHLTDGVQRALGREPRDFADFAREAAASGVWTPQRAVAGAGASA
jgi:uncharacterized protein YbjT (DUF2867 family)